MQTEGLHLMLTAKSAEEIYQDLTTPVQTEHIECSWVEIQFL